MEFVCCLCVILLVFTVNAAKRELGCEALPKCLDTDPKLRKSLEDMTEESECKLDNEKDVKFILYTSEKKREVLFDKTELKNSYFNKDKPVKMSVHGWRGDENIPFNVVVKDAFFEKEKDLNVIIVDWGKNARCNFFTARNNVPKIGKIVGKFIKMLIERGTNLDKFHLIGYSLGGHVVGLAGREVNGKVPYITSLDPAILVDEEHRIKPSDGVYVEVIHTGCLGSKYPAGDNDFYPNKGKFQPGCGLDPKCSHARSFKYFAESIVHNKGFMAIQCTDHNEMKGSSNCANLSQLHMGGISPKEARGVFYLETNKNKPYHKG